MHENTRFRVNQPTIISEIIDQEAILINLDTGAYYSLREAGAEIWRLVELGASNQQIVEQLSQTYASPAETTANRLQTLLAELQAEQLIFPANGEVPPEIPLPPPSAGERPSLPALVLEKYTDMSELLLLDPIHEVDEPGWPLPKKAA